MYRICSKLCQHKRPGLPTPSWQLHFSFEANTSPVEEGVVTAGGQYTLQCMILFHRPEAVERNHTLLEVIWFDPDDHTITSGPSFNISGMPNTTESTLNSTITFTRLTTSQGGLYSCGANLTIPDVTTDFQVIRHFPVRVERESFQHIFSVFNMLLCSIQFPILQMHQWLSNKEEMVLSMWGHHLAWCVQLHSQWIQL